MSLFTLISTATPPTKRKFEREGFFVLGHVSCQDLFDSPMEIIDQLSDYKLDLLIIHEVVFTHPSVKEIIDRLKLRGFKVYENKEEEMIIASNNQTLSVNGRHYYYDHSGWGKVHLNISKKHTSPTQKSREAFGDGKQALVIDFTAEKGKFARFSHLLLGGQLNEREVVLKAVKNVKVKMLSARTNPLPSPFRIFNIKWRVDGRLFWILSYSVIFVLVVVGTILYRRQKSQKGINA